MLFKWFLDLPIDAASFDASTFSKNRQRLLGSSWKPAESSPSTPSGAQTAYSMSAWASPNAGRGRILGCVRIRIAKRTRSW